MVLSEFSCCSNTGKVIFEWCKQVADNRDAPWSAQEPLPRQSAHVGHVRIVDWKAKDPGKSNQRNHGVQNSQGGERQDRERNRGRHRKIILRFWSQNKSARKSYLPEDLYIYIPLHLSAPEYVLLLVHVDGEMLVLALLDGIRPGGDGPHLVKLRKKGNERNISPRVLKAVCFSSSGANQPL